MPLPAWLRLLPLLGLLACQPAPDAPRAAFAQALETGNTARLQTLLHANPHLATTPDAEGWMPLHTATAQGQPEVVALLLDAGAAADATLPNGRNALFLTDDPALIRRLLDAGADPQQTDRRGRTPMVFQLNYARLFHELRPQKRDALTAYLDADVAFPTTGDAGATWLHGAAEIGHARLAAHLLRHGSDATSRNTHGGTLLHAAAAGGLAALTDSLLRAGFAPDARDRYGLTPLFFAAMEGHAEAAAALRHAGADATLTDPAGRTASAYARDFGHDALAQMLADGAPPGATSTLDLRGPYLGQPPPGRTPTRFAPGLLSTVHYDHSAPTFTADGRRAYGSLVYTQRGDFFLEMTQQPDGRWSAPAPLPFCAAEESCMYPNPSPDGTRLYYTSDRATPDRPAGQGRDIWYTERTDTGWGAPQRIGFDGGDEYGLSVAANGTLYFMADYAGGTGSTDLYHARLVDGTYQAPENLGPQVNSPGYEDEPHIAPDERFLLFTSLRPSEAGPLFLSVRGPDQAWQAPVPFQTRLGMAGDVRFPALSPDGRYLFFASNPDGNWDLYWVEAAVLGDLLP